MPTPISRLRGLLFLLAMATLALVLLQDAGAQPPDRGDKATLQLLAKENAANRGALRTWQGQVTSKTHALKVATSGGKRKAGDTRSITFAWDGAARRYSFLTNEPWPGEAEKGAFPFSQLRWGAIRTPEGYFHVTPWKGDDKKEGKRAKPITIFDRPTLQIGSPSAESRGDFSPDFDPFFYLDVMGEDPQAWLMDLHDNWDKYKHHDVSVARSGELVTVKIKQPMVLDQQYTFDLGQGANLVSNHNRDDLIEVKRKREFNKVSGVWVPVSAHTESRNLQTGVVKVSEVAWIESKVNQPVPPSAFALATLGLKPGDDVNDERTKTRSTYGPADEIAAPPAGNWTLFVILASSIAAVLLLLVGWWLRMKWRQKGAIRADAI